MFFNHFFLASIFSSDKLHNKVKRDLNNGDHLDLMIQFKPMKDEEHKIETLIAKLQEHNELSYNKIRDTMNRHRRSIEHSKLYYISNSMSLKTNSSQLVRDLASLDCVIEISSNHKFHNSKYTINAKQPTEWSGSTLHWGISYIQADNLPNYVYRNAAKLRYANSDTGVDFNHPVLKANYLGYDNKTDSFNHNYSWWDANKHSNETKPNDLCGVDSKIPCDDTKHGTHTMSTVVATGNLGIVNTTKWLACKNMDQNFGSSETYLGCLQFLIAPTRLDGSGARVDLRPHVIGNSYGCTNEEGCSQLTLNIAMNNIRKAGIFMSVSSGNDGRSGCSTINSPPATDPLSFNVGALKYQSNDAAGFTSKGPVSTRLNAIDVVAPGVNITGAVPGNKYSIFQGTSMASPHISAAALLIMAACPKLYRKVDLVESLIRQTATSIYSNFGCGNDTSTTIPNNEYGFGLLNVRKAIEVCSKNSTSTNLMPID